LSLFSLAGARRVQSSYPRFLRAAKGSTLTIGDVGGADKKTQAAIARLPEVTSASSQIGFNVFVRAAGRPTLTSENLETVGSFVPSDQDLFTATEGRLAVPTRPDEIVVNEFAARQFDIKVGARVLLDTYATDQVSTPGFFNHLPAPKFTQPATVVGVGVFPDEVLQDDGDRTGRLLLTPAFSARAQKYQTYALQSLTLRHGDRDVASVEQRIAALTPGSPTTYRVHSVDTYHAEQALRPLSIALAVFGAITGLAAIVLVSLALGTILRTAAEDRAVLSAQGMTRRQIARVLAAGPIAIVLAGVPLAMLLAFAASPLMPIGPVRRVEPHRGLSADFTILGFGALALIFVLVVFAASRAWWLSSGAPTRRRISRSRISEAAITAGLPTSGVIGLQSAFDPAGARTASSNRSLVAGAVVALAALTGAVTFGASMHRLVHEPRLFGWNWDAALLSGDGYDNMNLTTAHNVLDPDPHIAAWSGAYFGDDAIDGMKVPVLAMASGSVVVPTLLQGRSTRDSDEIVLGARIARELGKHIGDRVLFGSRSGPRELSVVGIATFPTIGRLHAAHSSLGVGALVAPQLSPEANKNIFGEPRAGLGPNVIFVRYKPHTDPIAEQLRLRAETRPLVSFAGFDVLRAQRPAEIVNASSTGNAPLVLALTLAAGAALSLALALNYAVRRRRRELMVLKTLGFTRRQVAATVWWQATATIVVALAIGIPIGVAAGAFMWAAFAHALDVVATPTIPILTVIGVSAAALVIANVTALGPARSARRLNPSTLLRSE
jgi:ABC-type antimicrobial peptide transport system permease subunit